MGCMVPVSLLANMIEASTVSFLIESLNMSRSTTPYLSTERYVTSNPSCSSKNLHVSSTAECSVFDVITCLPFSRFARATPFIAKLSLSVPPDVNTMSTDSVPIVLAITSLEDSTALSAAWPLECTLDALPYSSLKYGIMASSTSLRTCVVAL